MRMIVYFHGLNSSSNSDKVARLRAAFPQDIVVAFDADVDPEKSINEVSRKINYALSDYFLTCDSLIFVGTSLGAWLAAELAAEYDCVAYLINPLHEPREILPRLGVDKFIADKYDDIILNKKSVFIFSQEDDVINDPSYKYDIQASGFDTYIIKGEDHRFNGAGFDTVINLISNKQ